MEQNNFEKNVQQKLDELKIPPSDAVWTNVEKRIGKKHKDRRVIFIVFFLILFLLSGGYWLLNSSENQQQNQPISHVLKKGSKATNKQDSSFGESKITSGVNYGSADSESVLAKTTKNLQVDSQNKIEKTRKKKQRKLIDEFTFEPEGNYSKATLPTGRQANNEDSEIALNNEDNLNVMKLDAIEIAPENFVENIKDNIQNKIENDDFLNQLKSEKTTKEIIAKNDSSLKKHTEKKEKHHWAFGITFSGGTSLIGESLLGVDNNNTNYPQSSPITSGSGGIGNGGNSSYTPSPINNSFAFIGGAFIEKNISSKSKISLGVSYKYFSLVNKVGNKIDSILSPPSQYLSVSNAYSSTNSSHVYRNNFHYLEVPVLFKTQLNKNKSLPLYWHVGINISQLISSNALQFQSNPGLYYNDNSLFSKTQFGLNTGVSATLFAKQKVPVTIGPYFYYDASKLANKGLYQNKHFSFIGIRAEILFHKK